MSDSIQPSEASAAQSPDFSSHAVVPPRGTRFLGTGRRKTAVARVRIMPGSGKLKINARDLNEYFSEVQDRDAVTAPFTVTNTVGLWDAHVTVHGGGHTGQAGAIRLGIARALLSANTALEERLRDSGYLTRDSREVERKKFGRRKARRRCQFSKR